MPKTVDTRRHCKVGLREHTTIFHNPVARVSRALSEITHVLNQTPKNLKMASTIAETSGAHKGAF